MFEKLFITLQALRGNFAARFETEEGATAVEYGLMVALIAAAIILTVTALGGSLNGLFTAISDAIAAATP